MAEIKQCVQTTVGEMRSIIADIFEECDNNAPDSMRIRLYILNPRKRYDSWTFDSGWGRG